MTDVWSAGDAYEAYVGRWSRAVAAIFVPWLGVRPNARWLDVGCGTGALTAAVLILAEPASIVGVDSSAGFLGTARNRVADPRAEFYLGDARELRLASSAYDAVVSGLAINFVPEPGAALTEFARVAKPGGVVAAYVWDYAEGMELMRHFWAAATTVDPGAERFHEGSRFALCHPDPLRALWTGAGLSDVVVDSIEIPTVFPTFADYWQPFLGGQGPGPAYAMSLDEPRRAVLRDELRSRLGEGPIELTARAWAVRGTR
ncbi:class I SAM-dependent methyltransferase [Hamadaea sp. NPDC051192]|uniref:class I SAM-dependent methyltransferase n=1 Tax=Hamadaea sp. NPDC051192 TaxID=3154940 RepID=UPI00342C73EF